MSSRVGVTPGVDGLKVIRGAKDAALMYVFKTHLSFLCDLLHGQLSFEHA